MTDEGHIDAGEEREVEGRFAERLSQLPKAVQNAIHSANIDSRLRELADKHKLHIDQWDLLEMEVKLALYGFQPVEDLAKNIETEVGTSKETAAAVAADISKVVFEPIREELERELEHPEAKEEEKSEIENARTKLLESSAARSVPSIEPTPPVPAPIAAATPPAPLPEQKVVRGPASGAYKSGEPSAARKDVRDDPYREVPA